VHAGKFGDIALQRGGQAQVVEQAGAQLAAEDAHLFQRLAGGAHSSSVRD
jgi:hypothetical protein